jgi:hypothetical protein
MLRRVALVRTDVSKELSVSFIMVIRIGELGISSQNASGATWADVPSSPILLTLMKEALSSSETSVQEQHGVTSQKTPFVLVIAVITSNLT